MKKIIIALIAGIFLLSVGSCANENQEYSYNIKDALKISAWVFDETIKGNVYGERDTVYTFERLELNEVRLMTPMVHSEMETVNLDIFLEFADGTFEVISEDKDVQLSFNNPLYPFRRSEGYGDQRIYGFEISLPNEGFISANPLGSNRGHTYIYDGIELLPVLVGRKYYLTVKAYKFDNTQSPVITAQLRLIQLDESNTNSAFGIGPFSIELISYEYSDMYKMMDEIWDDED